MYLLKPVFFNPKVRTICWGPLAATACIWVLLALADHNFQVVAAGVLVWMLVSYTITLILGACRT